MPPMGFESTIPVFERAQTVHALDRAATMIGHYYDDDDYYYHYYHYCCTSKLLLLERYSFKILDTTVYCDTEMRKQTCSGGRTRAFSYLLQVRGIARRCSLSHLYYYAVAIVFWRPAWYSVQLHVNTDARVPPCPESFATCVFWGPEERLTIVSIIVMELFNYMKWKSRYSPGKHSFPGDSHKVQESIWII
jgi:hypothetical protein